MIAKLLRVAGRPRELSDRLRQELANLRLLRFPPRLPSNAPTLPHTPFPPPTLLRERLAGSPLAAHIAERAAAVRRHHVSLLGFTADLGTSIAWRRDPASGRETGLSYFRRIPYLDFSRTGDHKVIWELNRHQHLALLAQDHALHGTPESLAELEQQISSWLAANPFQRGINWASALEVAFRSLSWIWIDHLAGASLSPPLRRRMLEALFQHGCHLEHNLSFYFSPNTHLLGESVGLHALGVAYPEWPHADRWKQVGHRVVAAQLERQVQPDGSHFEQSSYYHVYALDMFLFHALLAGCAREWSPVLRRMCAYLDGLLGSSRRLPYLGDDDGGRFFFPYGPHRQFGRATLATAAALLPDADWNWSAGDFEEQAAWWLVSLPASHGAAVSHCSRRFPDSGLVVLCQDDAQVIFDVGSFGGGPAGHSHSDALQLVIRAGGEDILIDPGTFTYVADPVLRDHFRGSASHNTVRIDGRDQAEPAGPFAWKGRPIVTCPSCQLDDPRPVVEGLSEFGGFRHRRSITLERGTLTVEDLVDGPSGAHIVEWHWHCGGRRSPRLLLPEGIETIPGWRSPALGHKEPSVVLRYTRTGELPVKLTWGVRL